MLRYVYTVVLFLAMLASLLPGALADLHMPVCKTAEEMDHNLRRDLIAPMIFPDRLALSNISLSKRVLKHEQLPPVQ